jgi:hypothetical protein
VKSKLTFSRTPIDPNPDLVTGARNEASTRIHWFTLLGGKAVTAPCVEQINDRFCMKVYNPKNENRAQLIKYGIWTGLAGFIGLLVGRWIGIVSERRHEKERRRWERDYSSDSTKLKRRHAREWK